LSVEVLSLSGTIPDAIALASTEIPWEVLDTFVHERADSTPGGPDAIARPSKPYISMDRGFGHAGFPAISVNADTAQAFCVWLSRRTGRTIRLPRVSELRAACEAGGGDGAESRSWHAGNSGGRTRRVDAGKPDRNGFHDLRGNVAEWALDENGKPVVWGGSFMDPPVEQGCDRVRRPNPEWNASDPQLPPSRWWLADGPFIGFRVAVEVDPVQNAGKAAESTASPKERSDGSRPVPSTAP
jgi:formylglycine-generating enzyme required for sulfatase activity